MARSLILVLVIWMLQLGAPHRAHAVEQLELDARWYSIVAPYRYEVARRFDAGWRRGAGTTTADGVVRAPIAGTVRFVGRVAGRMVVTLDAMLGQQPVVVTLSGIETAEVRAGARIRRGGALGRGDAVHVGVYDPHVRSRYLPVVQSSFDVPSAPWSGDGSLSGAVAGRLLDAIAGTARLRAPRAGSVAAAAPPAGDMALRDDASVPPAALSVQETGVPALVRLGEPFEVGRPGATRAPASVRARGASGPAPQASSSQPRRDGAGRPSSTGEALLVASVAPHPRAGRELGEGSPARSGSSASGAFVGPAMRSPGSPPSPASTRLPVSPRSPAASARHARVGRRGAPPRLGVVAVTEAPVVDEVGAVVGRRSSADQRSRTGWPWFAVLAVLGLPAAVVVVRRRRRALPPRLEPGVEPREPVLLPWPERGIVPLPVGPSPLACADPDVDAFLVRAASRDDAPSRIPEHA